MFFEVKGAPRKTKRLLGWFGGPEETEVKFGEDRGQKTEAHNRHPTFGPLSEVLTPLS